MTQMRIRPLVVDAAGTQTLESRAFLRLVGADGQPMIGVRTTDGAPVTTYVERTVAADAPLVVELTPQSRIARPDAAASYYMVEIRAGHRHEPYRIQVPDSPDVLELADLVGGSAVAPADILAGRLLPTPAAVPDAWMLSVDSGAPVWTAPPAGTGDMRSLVYDPAGVAANCFDLANLSGALDGGTFF